MNAITYLTSNPSIINWEVTPPKSVALNEENGFVEALRKDWKEEAKCLLIASDPKAHWMMEGMRADFTFLFEKHQLDTKVIDTLDGRNEISKQALESYDVIILCGGHVPTQNKYFKEIQLKEKLKDYEGMIIGISAGSMNSASMVYAAPEEEGESLDPSFKRFIEGLGLTDIMIIPHWQYVRTLTLDGKSVEKDIAYADSYGRHFLALVDGSYVRLQEGKAVIYGEAYEISDGKCSKVCEKDEQLAW